jgi:LuxR family maltose regulon positive regulatory protein
MLVQRPHLLSRLQGSPAPIVLVSAPSGYGKSVLIGQWAEQDPRPYPTLILGEEHNDPAMLVASILAVLDPIEPVHKGVGIALANPEPSMEGVVLPRLGSAIEQRELPFVLVLDDFERIESPQSLPWSRRSWAGFRADPSSSWLLAPSRSCRSAGFAPTVNLRS